MTLNARISKIPPDIPITTTPESQMSLYFAEPLPKIGKLPPTRTNKLSDVTIQKISLANFLHRWASCNSHYKSLPINYRVSYVAESSSHFRQPVFSLCNRYWWKTHLGASYFSLLSFPGHTLFSYYFLTDVPPIIDLFSSAIMSSIYTLNQNSDIFLPVVHNYSGEMY